MLKRSIDALLVGFVLVFAGVVGFLTYLYSFYNIHTVVPDTVYRSALIPSHVLGEFVQEHDIKAVLDLTTKGDRHHKNGEAYLWVEKEQAVLRELGVDYIHYPIPNRSEVENFEMSDIIAIMREAPKPLLIHCKHGSDRTGLVSALYLNAIANDDSFSEQLSLRYGHFPWLGSKTAAMGVSLERFITPAINAITINP